MKQLLSTLLLMAVAVMTMSNCGKNDDTIINETQTTSIMTKEIYIKANGTVMPATLADNVATRHLLQLLQKGNITVSTHDYGGWEKVGTLPGRFPSDNHQITTQPGDFVLYSGNQLVLFYGSNSWSYTRLGHIDGMSASQLKAVLGDGNVDITLSINK